jgi:broad specificity phosphatase PhoE
MMEPYAPPARITFISHAATQAQRVAAFPLDETLDSEEVDKIAAMGWTSPRAQQVLSGPEQRAFQTAQALGLSASPSADLRDCDYGVWSGRRLDELQTSAPEGLVAWLSDAAAVPHGGESVLQLIERIGRWLDGQRDAGHTIAVTHSAVIRAAILYALDAPAHGFWRVDISPLSVTDLRFNGRSWTLRSVGRPIA